MCFFVAAHKSPYQQDGWKVVINTEIKPATYLGDILFAAVPKSPSQQKSRMIVLRTETEPATYPHDAVIAWIQLLQCLYVFLSSYKMEMRCDYKSQVE